MSASSFFATLLEMSARSAGRGTLRRTKVGIKEIGVWGDSFATTACYDDHILLLSTLNPQFMGTMVPSEHGQDLHIIRRVSNHTLCAKYLLIICSPRQVQAQEQRQADEVGKDSDSVRQLRSCNSRHYLINFMIAAR